MPGSVSFYRRSCIFFAAAVLATTATLARGVMAQSAAPANVPSKIVSAFDTMFGGPHPGQRAVHAKGLLCSGVFIPDPAAASLTRAEHFTGGRVPILVRFSNFAAVPGMPDGDPASSPRGLAVKFLLRDGERTDIVAHSYDGFPASTPEEFLSFLQAVPDPAALAIFAAHHAAARAFLADPKPAPVSYGTEAYFGVNAFRFINAAGVATFGRYHFVPLAGLSHLDATAAAAQPPGFLAQAMQQQLRQAPVAFRLEVQLAGAGDVVEDGASPWPATRPTVVLGTLELNALAEADDARQTGLAFSPTNLVGGIDLTEDPMLLARTLAYRVSARRRSPTN